MHHPSEATTPLGHPVNRPRRVADAHLAAVLAGTEPLLFDGAMGTQLQARGLAAGESPELLCLTNPDEVTAIHAAYVAAGAEAITTNTFGANATKLAGAASVEQVFAAAVACARAAGARYVAADIGPTGSLLQPLGTLPFDAAYQLFAEQVRAAAAAGADLFVIETMADLAEAKAALLAVREHSDLPAFVTMTFDEDGRTFLGTTPEVAAVTLGSLGADVLGINCSLGPAEVAPLVARMVPWARCPVMAQANAGLPQVEGGVTRYGIGPREYGAAVAEMLDAGVTVIGGCCGTTPAYTATERTLLDARANAGGGTAPVPAGGEPAGRRGDCACDEPRATVPSRGSALTGTFTATSAQRLVALRPGAVGVIGERLNPTGKPRMREALRSGNHDHALSEAIAQERAGAQILDVNAGLPEIDEHAVMCRLVSELQGVTTLPLQIDSADPVVIEAAVRSYPGKPIINSCNGRPEALAAVLPIARHYGCAVVGLTLDEQGIPDSAEGRLAIARRIVAAADELGIPRADVAIDCLAMAASTDQAQPARILEAIRLVRRELPGVRCVLGVSNISFGLPARPLVNATFLAAALAAGLDLAIINPSSRPLADAVAAWRVLSGEDEAAGAFVRDYADWEERGGLVGDSPSGAPGAKLAGPAPAAGADGGQAAPSVSPEDEVRELVISGRKEAVPAVVATLLADAEATHDALYVIDRVLIPALDEVGERFAAGSFFLPQLMASAEAAKAGFEVLRASSAGANVARKGAVALATVRGDIHDIGKNIVRMLLENYGYEVVDLGRDVDPQLVADTVAERHIRLCGLSALMTTTVPAMAETIALLRERAPWCKVIVGGAVLNPEYAQMVGADFYARDAAETARIAGEVLG